MYKYVVLSSNAFLQHLFKRIRMRSCSPHFSTSLCGLCSPSPPPPPPSAHSRTHGQMRRAHGMIGGVDKASCHIVASSALHTAWRNTFATSLRHAVWWGLSGNCVCVALPGKDRVVEFVLYCAMFSDHSVHHPCPLAHRYQGRTLYIECMLLYHILSSWYITWCFVVSVLYRGLLFFIRLTMRNSALIDRKPPHVKLVFIAIRKRNQQTRFDSGWQSSMAGKCSWFPLINWKWVFKTFFKLLKSKGL